MRELLPRVIMDERASVLICNMIASVVNCRRDIWVFFVGSFEELGGTSTSRLEQSYKWERHHTLTQNLKAMGLWVLILIRCLTFTFLSDSHLHTTLPLKCESINSLCSPFKQKLLLACIVVVGFFANGPTLLVPSLPAQTDWLPRSYPSSNRGSNTIVGSLEELGGMSTPRLEQSYKRERHHTLAQNLHQISTHLHVLIHQIKPN